MRTACLPVVSVDLVRAALRSEDTPKHFTEETLRDAERRYRRFLTLCMLHPTAPIAPTRDIDHMWHLHMLHPRVYQEDCQQMFGEVLDHDGGFGSEPDELPVLERAFAETAALYRAEFGEEYSLLSGGGEQARSDAMVKCTRNCVSRCQRRCKTRA